MEVALEEGSDKIWYSQELLWHFHCGECKGWWTIADIRLSGELQLSCPHCGKRVPTCSGLRRLPPVELRRVSNRRTSKLPSWARLLIALLAGLAIGITLNLIGVTKWILGQTT